MDAKRGLPAENELESAPTQAGMTHHVNILEMNGDSYRLKQSKRRQRQPTAGGEPADNQPQD